MSDAKHDSKKRKYTLFKADDGRPDHLKPCAFFAGEGCKNGSKCRFMHGNAPVEVPQPVQKAAVKIPEPFSAVADSATKDSKKRKKNEDDDIVPQPKKQSSARVEEDKTPRESEEIRMLKEQVNLQRQMFEQQMELLTKRLMDQKQPPAQPIVNQQQTSVSSAKKTPIKAPVVATPASKAKMQVDSDSDESESESEPDSESDSEKSDDGKFLFDAVNHVLERGANQTTPVQSRSSARNISNKQSSTAAKAVPTPVAVLNQQTAVSRASTSESSDDDSDIFVNPQSKGNKGPNAVINPSKKKDIFAAKATTPASSSVASVGTPFMPEQVNFASLRYHELVALTQSHRRFANDYNFSPDYTWVNSKQGAKGPARVIAMDCEMCETIDPVTNEKEANSLVRFSVVDALNPSVVLIDQLVCPTNPISDSRTRIHGITEEQLNSVKFTLRHAQAALLKLVNEDTIIIGHSLHHDLKAMHIIHENVVDTAYLFSTVDVNAPNGDTIPSLRMLAEQVLQLKTPVKLHDSVEDSRISCYSAAYHLLNDGQFPAMQRSKTDRGSNGRSGQDDSTLLVHHIPSFCGEEHIERLFLSFTNIAPVKVNPISRTVDAADASHGKTLVQFLTAKHAELAFDTIQGAIKPDKQNRPQKRVFLKNGTYVNVRK